MILTINFIDMTYQKILAVCNLHINTMEPEEIRAAYRKYLQQVHTPDFTGSAADLMQEVTCLVMKEHPHMVLLSVNDNPNLAEEANALHVEMTSKNLTSKVIQYSSGNDDEKYTS